MMKSRSSTGILRDQSGSNQNEIVKNQPTQSLSLTSTKFTIASPQPPALNVNA